MIRILFLIGNGFDIATGLRTGYRNFLNNYTRDITKDIDTNIFKTVLVNDIKYWADFEKRIGEYDYTEYFERPLDYYNVIKNCAQSLTAHMKNESNKASYKNEHEIAVGMEKLICNFYQSLEDKSKESIIKLLEPNEKKPQKECSFISFNFTNNFDNCVKIFNLYNNMIDPREFNGRTISDVAYENVIHINRTKTGRAIIGVDNEEQISNKDFANSKYSEKIIKHKLDKISSNYYDSAKRHIKNSDIICIFGMSIGESDITWWKSIGEWLLANQNHELVICFWSKDLGDAVQHQIDIISDVQDRFLMLSETPEEEQDNIRERIHISLEKDIINFKVI